MLEVKRLTDGEVGKGTTFHLRNKGSMGPSEGTVEVVGFIRYHNTITIPNDGNWTELMFPGNDLKWRSTHTVNGDGTNPCCSELTLDWGDEPWPWTDRGHGLAGTYGKPALTI